MEARQFKSYLRHENRQKPHPPRKRTARSLVGIFLNSHFFDAAHMEGDRVALVVKAFSHVAPRTARGAASCPRPGLSRRRRITSPHPARPVGIEPVQCPVLALLTAAAQSPTPQLPATGRSLPLHPRAGMAAVRHLSGNMLMNHPAPPSQSLLHGRLLAFAAIDRHPRHPRVPFTTAPADAWPSSRAGGRCRGPGAAWRTAAARRLRPAGA